MTTVVWRNHGAARRRIADVPAFAPISDEVGGKTALGDVLSEALATSAARLAREQNGANDSAASAGVANRSSGFFASMRSMTASRSLGTLGFASDTSGAGDSA